jgi:hypothetical protein
LFFNDIADRAIFMAGKARKPRANYVQRDTRPNMLVKLGAGQKLTKARQETTMRDASLNGWFYFSVFFQ